MKKYPSLLQQGKNLALTIGRIYDTIRDKNSQLITREKYIGEESRFVRVVRVVTRNLKDVWSVGVISLPKQKSLLKLCPLGKWEEDELTD